MQSHHKLFKNCSIHCKNCEISGSYNFWTSIKSSIPDVWNWNFWTFFVLEIEVGEQGGYGYAPVNCCAYFDDMFCGTVVWWLSLPHNFIQLNLNSGSVQVQTLLVGVGDLRWWGSLTMVPAGNKAKRLSSVNHTAKTIHHHCNIALFFLAISCCANIKSYQVNLWSILMFFI